MQDTLRQIQEIRTYYDFPDIDIDRYQIGGSVRQMMLATRELNVEKLPQSSRNWINEKLIYTHGYGVTMNPVNGFTSEGLPTLVLSNMPIQSTIPGLSVTRPEIYFGELTNTDVYVKTRQKEFDYPQGDANSLTSYQGSGGIRLGGLLRRTLIAFDRGDIAKLPFSDDVNSESRLLMRRKLSERVHELAPFLTLDADPYVVVGEDGRIRWLMDAFTTSDGYPFARRYLLGNEPHQLHSQQRQNPDRCVHRRDDILRVRHAGSDHRRLSGPVSRFVRRRGGDAGCGAQACAVPGTVVERTGRRLWSLPHDQSRCVLQPRGPLERRHGNLQTISANRSWNPTSC